MRRSTWLWMAVGAVCLVATIHELPNAVISLRYARALLFNSEKYATWLVPERLIARDPEAGAILRYGIEYHYNNGNLADLKALVDRYPENEFFLSILAEGLAPARDPGPAEALALADRLVTMAPDNAYYRYLRGWILLQGSAGQQRVDEALGQLELGHELPRFDPPYKQYKPRVDQLADRAVLNGFRRPWVRPFYCYSDFEIAAASTWEDVDPNQLLRLAASATRIADRAIAHAYDFDSLQAGTGLQRWVEWSRLRKFRLTTAEARQARQRLAQAAAADDSPDDWTDGLWLAMPGGLFAMAWILVASALFALRGWPRWPTKLRRGAAAGRRIDPHSNSVGLYAFVHLAVLLVLYRWRADRPWLQFVLYYCWTAAWLWWLIFPSHFARISSVSTGGDRTNPRIVKGYVFLWLNGTLLLLIGTSRFFASGSLAGWTREIGVVSVWSILCVLLWWTTFDAEAALGRIPYRRALKATLLWAGALIAFNALGGHWDYESRIWAKPLSLHRPLPPATEATYERIIRDSVPLGYRRGDPNALPEYIDYMAPKDMERFLKQRRAEGRPVDERDLRNLRDRSARDVRPVIQAMIDGRLAEKIHEAEIRH